MLTPFSYLVWTARDRILDDIGPKSRNFRSISRFIWFHVLMDGVFLGVEPSHMVSGYRLRKLHDRLDLGVRPSPIPRIFGRAAPI